MDLPVQNQEKEAARSNARPLPPASNDNSIGIVRAPMHTDTQSSLTPTSEFTRLLLLAFPSRYIARGPAKILFPGDGRSGPRELFYTLAMGIGSLALSLKYSAMVKRDIKNIYSETVAMEKGVAPDQVTFNDIRASDNKIVQDTMHTYRSRMYKRIGTDALFFLAAPLVNSTHGKLNESSVKEGITDTLVGVKGGMALTETWNRKTTVFEDLVTFITNKLNPRNGLGQPVSMGELFDLYQHYTEVHAPEKMFRNVLTRDSSEEQMHAINKPVFTRMTELMNLTYAYKHSEADSAKAHGADFALPKFIYLLGHDLIDPMRPDRTLALVEIMNARGAEGVRQAVPLLNQGLDPAQLLQQFGITPPAPKQPAETAAPANHERNTVIAKGSTMQPDLVPSTSIEAAGASTAQLAAQAAQLTQ